LKKETLIKVIDEEFGDNKEMSWLINVVKKAFVKNDSRITEATKPYQERANKVNDYLTELYDELVKSEKEEMQSGIRVTHKRKVNNSKTEDKD
jgi:hypothetical protein